MTKITHNHFLPGIEERKDRVQHLGRRLPSRKPSSEIGKKIAELSKQLKNTRADETFPILKNRVDEPALSPSLSKLNRLGSILDTKPIVTKMPTPNTHRPLIILPQRSDQRQAPILRERTCSAADLQEKQHFFSKLWEFLKSLLCCFSKRKNDHDNN